MPWQGCGVRHYTWRSALPARKATVYENAVNKQNCKTGRLRRQRSVTIEHSTIVFWLKRLNHVCHCNLQISFYKFPYAGAACCVAKLITIVTTSKYVFVLNPIETKIRSTFAIIRFNFTDTCFT